MDEKEKQIANWVREIDDLRAQVAKHWSMIQKNVEDARMDDVISLLNAYFRSRQKLEGVESNLRSMLGGYFSDR